MVYFLRVSGEEAPGQQASTRLMEDRFQAVVLGYHRVGLAGRAKGCGRCPISMEAGEEF
jgi:hypothetical protein